jgi:arylsulfatase A-like enzyme
MMSSQTVPAAISRGSLDFLDAEGLAENTIVIYTSDQGFFLGEHGWFDTLEFKFR